MLPSIGLVQSVEMIRDGGSLAAIFQGTDLCQYWLLLQVRLIQSPSGEWERMGYESPVIVDRLAQRQISITWHQAQIFLSQVKPFIHHERDLYWFAVLSEAVQLQGPLPNEVDRDFGRSKQNQ